MQQRDWTTMLVGVSKLTIVRLMQIIQTGTPVKEFISPEVLEI
jgi:hypothetical protein